MSDTAFTKPISHMTANDVDVVVIGGGIAGLWTLNVLCQRGYNAILLESEALGSDQTVASQGMIHGGIKYTLGGALTGASEAIADMPDHWRACLRGEGDVNLRGARVLSEHFYLWSTASVGSRLGGFFASKLTRGRVDNIETADLPDLFRTPAFKGRLYKLVDMVMDTQSVLKALAERCASRIFHVPSSFCTWGKEDTQVVLRIAMPDSGCPDNGCTLRPKVFVFAAGRGNAALLDSIGARTPQMQLRPLQQVMVRHRLNHTFYGHCLGAESTPRLTISTHPLSDGSQVWYLGGSLAEKGAQQSADQVIDAARQELANLMPWLDFSAAEWAAWPVSRAEPRQRRLARPDNAFAAWTEPVSNVITAWPTKLTLSPHLAMEVARLLQERAISPSGAAAPTLPFIAPRVSPAPWETVFGVPAKAYGETS